MTLSSSEGNLCVLLSSVQGVVWESEYGAWREGLCTRGVCECGYRWNWDNVSHQAAEAGQEGKTFYPWHLVNVFLIFLQVLQFYRKPCIFYLGSNCDLTYTACVELLPRDLFFPHFSSNSSQRKVYIIFQYYLRQKRSKPCGWLWNYLAVLMLCSATFAQFCHGRLFLTCMGLFVKLAKYFTGIPSLLVPKEHPKLLMKSTRQVLGVGIASCSCISQRAWRFMKYQNVWLRKLLWKRL